MAVSASIVRIDHARRAREEAQHATHAYLIERVANETKAVRKARLLRLARDKRMWTIGLLVACSASAVLASLLTNYIAAPVVTHRESVFVPVPAQKPESVEPAATIAPAAAATVTNDSGPQPTEQVLTEPTPIAADKLTTTVADSPVAPMKQEFEHHAPQAVQTAAKLALLEMQLTDARSAITKLNAENQDLKQVLETKQRVTATAPKPATPLPAPSSTSLAKISERTQTPTPTATRAPVPAVKLAAATPSSTSLQPSYSAKAPTSPNQAAAQTSNESIAAAAAPVVAKGFTVVGMPTDRIVLVKIQGDDTIHPVTVGQKLPSGETLKSVNPAGSVAATDQRTIGLAKN